MPKSRTKDTETSTTISKHDDVVYLVPPPASCFGALIEGARNPHGFNSRAVPILDEVNLKPAAIDRRLPNLIPASSDRQTSLLMWSAIGVPTRSQRR